MEGGNGGGRGGVKVIKGHLRPTQTHLVHIFLVCSEMTPHCCRNKEQVNAAIKPAPLLLLLTVVSTDRTSSGPSVS